MASTSLPLAFLALLFTFSYRTSAQSSNETCASYGVDFQPNGTYFQNESSTLPFTFVSIFEGCQPSICQNLLVDPNGNEYECSNTELTPADTNQLSTCDIDEDEMTSGEWTVILNSNNGDGNPIAYMREFSLIVGIPTTITYTPTFTATATITDYANVTTTQTTDVVLHLNTTVIDPAATIAPTITLHPSSTTTITTTMGTVSKTAHEIDPWVVTETYTAQCTLPAPQQWPDPWCTFTPTLYTIPALATPKPVLPPPSPAPAQPNPAPAQPNPAPAPPNPAPAQPNPPAPAQPAPAQPAPAQSSGQNSWWNPFSWWRRRSLEVSEEEEEEWRKEGYLQARRERLAQKHNNLAKRGLDSSITTITQTIKSLCPTITETITASTSTLLITTMETDTITSLTTLTELEGTWILPTLTVTNPLSLITKHAYTVITETVTTITLTPTVIISTTTTPAWPAAICTDKGGFMW